MPKRPQDQKRPTDVMEIATGQRGEEYDRESNKDKAAAELGRRGGKARAERMTAEQRAHAARKRWRDG
jgi:hypothetical protein